MTSDGTKHASQLLYGKRRFFLWELDSRTGTFMASADENTHFGGEMWKLKRFEEIFSDQPPSAETLPHRSNTLTFRFGPSSIQLWDVRQLPIAEIGIHGFSLVAAQSSLISQAHSTLNISAYSYNALLKDWEPILMPTALLVNYGHNLSAFVIPFLDF